MAASPIPYEVFVVRGSVGDLGDVMHVMSSAFEPEFGEGWSLSQCAGIMPLKGVDLMLAREATGHVCGFSLSRTIEQESELLLLAVSSESQCRGVGQLLLDHFVENGRNHQCTLLHLEVRDGNRAIGMYRRAGFIPVGIRQKYYRGIEGARFDAVTMAMDLDE